MRVAAAPPCRQGTSLKSGAWQPGQNPMVGVIAFEVREMLDGLLFWSDILTLERFETNCNYFFLPLAI